jgi:hypothetical protein
MRLEHRVAKSLTDANVTSSELADLFGELQAAITDADKAVEEERKKALDPVASPNAKAAREAMQSAEFARDRLRTLQPRLQARFIKVQRVEKKAAWVREYDALAPRVAAQAEKLKAVYLKLVPELVDILTEARELNAEVRRVSSAKPFPESGEGDDGRHLYEVELLARGYSDLGQQGLSLDRDMVLPNFAEPTEKAWPPHETPLAVQVAQSVLALVQRLPPPGS